MNLEELGKELNLEELSKELDRKIPRDVIEERDGGGGRKLSYLPGWYVIDRLNKVFGHMNWSKEITDVRPITNKTSKGEFPAYLVKVRLEAYIDNSAYVVKEAYGYGADKSNQNAHELAIKEAVTDALKVAAKDLGMSLGLALYDKSQEYVDDGETETESEGRDNSVRDSKKERVEGDRAPQKDTAPEPSPNTLELIQTLVKVARAQKKSEKTKDYFKSLGINSPDGLITLSPEQLNSARVFLEELVK